MNWSTTKDMITDLNLSSDSLDKEAILRELKEELKKVHPDISGGEYSSEANKNRTERLLRAKEFIQNNSKNEILEKKQMDVMIHVLDKLTISQQLESKAAYVRYQKELKIDIIERIKHRSLFPKVGSGAFFIISSFLFAFGNSLRDDPYLIEILNMYSFHSQNYTVNEIRHFMLILSILSLLLFVIIWIQESKKKDSVEMLMSTHYAEQTLKAVIDKRKQHSEVKHYEEEYHVNYKDLYRQLEMRFFRKNPRSIYHLSIISFLDFLPFSVRFDSLDLEKIAKAQYASLEESKILQNGIYTYSKELHDEFKI